MFYKKLLFVAIGLLAIAVTTVVIMKYVFGSEYEDMGDKGYII